MQKASDLETNEVALDSLILDEDRMRKDLDSEDAQEAIQDLADSIKAVGVINPISVIPCGNRYKVVAGERRYRAAKESELEMVPVRIFSEDISVRQIQIIENLQREDLDPVTKIEAFESFMKERNLHVQDAAEELGLKRTTVYNWKAVLEVDERYKEDVKNNFETGEPNLTISAVAETVSLAKEIEVDEIINPLLDAIKRHELARSKIRKITKTLRDKPEECREDPEKAIAQEVENVTRSAPSRVRFARSMPIVKHSLATLLDTPDEITEESVNVEEFKELHQYVQQLWDILQEKKLLLEDGEMAE